jgi:hypothetical protein
MLSIIFVFSCNQSNSYDTKEICTTWAIITKDSLYNEFYFDNHDQVMFFDGESREVIYDYNIFVLVEKDERYTEFIEKMCKTNTINEQKHIILKFAFELFGNTKLLNPISIKPLDSFQYFYTNDIIVNSKLFEKYSKKRFFNYHQLNDTANSSSTKIVF